MRGHVQKLCDLTASIQLPYVVATAVCKGDMEQIKKSRKVLKVNEKYMQVVSCNQHARLYVNSRKTYSSIHLPFVAHNPLERKTDREAGASALSWEWLVLLVLFPFQLFVLLSGSTEGFYPYHEGSEGVLVLASHTGSTYFCCLL